VDAGHAWLIFALPLAEVAVHPAENVGHELHFMSDDLNADIAALGDKDVRCSKLGRSKVGFGDEDPASRWRRSRSLPAEASIPIGPHLALDSRS
jgi:hypothetical protein